MKKVLLLLVAILSIFSFGVASAAVNIQTAEYVADADDVARENVYVTASSIAYSGIAQKDVMLVGDTILFDGKVTGDLIVIGKDVIVSGEVEGDIKIVAAKAIYSANSGGDVVFLVGELEMLEVSTIKKDAMIYGGTIGTNGAIEGNTSIISGKTFLQGSFSNHVSISAQNVTVGNVVLSNFAEIDYSAPSRAEVLGDPAGLILNFNETGSWRENGIIKHAFLVFVSFWTVLRFVTTLIIIFFFTNGFRRFTQSFIDQTNKRPLKSLLAGALVLIGVPILALLLIISLVGLPIGLLLGLAYFALFVVRYALMSIVVGGFIKKLAKRDTSVGNSNFWFALLGLALITLIAFIPYFGKIFTLLMTLIAFGSVAYVVMQPVIRLKK